MEALAPQALMGPRPGPDAAGVEGPLEARRACVAAGDLGPVWIDSDGKAHSHTQFGYARDQEAFNLRDGRCG